MVWIWDTRAERICDTLAWFPTKVTMPPSSTSDTIVACLHNIVKDLQNPSPASSLAPRSDTQSKALSDLTTLLTNIVAPPLRVPEAAFGPDNVLAKDSPPKPERRQHHL
jgi:hypothetical protein